MRTSISILFLFGLLSTLTAQQVTIDESLATLAVVQAIDEHHFSPAERDDALSVQMMDAFIAAIDPDRNILTEEEVGLLRGFENDLDEQLESGTSEFLDRIHPIYVEAVDRARRNLKEAIDRLDLEDLESIHLQPISERSVSRASVDQWRLLVAKSLAGSSPSTSQAARLEERKKETAIEFQRQLGGHPTQRNDLFEYYLNSFVKLNDYQSEYFSPRSKEIWNVQYDRSFVGIGVYLSMDGDHPRIDDVILDGPAWRSKNVQAGQTILGVSESEGEYVSLAGLTMSEVVGLLKGPENSVVHLELLDATGEKVWAEVIREKILLEQVMSFRLSMPDGVTDIGYLRIPRFYQADGGVAEHVSEALEEFNEHKVAGAVLDLRDCNGGSVREVIGTLGLFIDEGALMQAKYRDGSHRAIEDEIPGMEFTKDLVVLTDIGSSSASELFAGTMQDYGRAVIAGSQTYGKGTIQRFVELDEENDSTILGEMKLTIGAFYTAGGRSPQYSGVSPDIPLAQSDPGESTGERAVAHSVRFDDIEAAMDPGANNVMAHLDELKSQSANRVKLDSRFSAGESSHEKYGMVEVDEQDSAGRLPYVSSTAQESNTNSSARLAHHEGGLLNDHVVHEAIRILEDLSLLDLSFGEE